MLLSCSGADIARGPGSETVAIAGQATYESGETAAECRVVLHKKDFLSPIPGQNNNSVYSAVTKTDKQGRFRIDSVFPGEYALEINDDQAHAVLLPCTVGTQKALVEIRKASLKPTSDIRGKFSLPADFNGSVYVRTYGLDRIFTTDATNGAFSLTGIPEGVYDIRITAISSDTLDSDIHNIQVSSEDTADAGTVNLASNGKYSFSRTIGLNTSPTGAEVSEDIPDFPVLVRLSESNFDFSQASSDGHDLKFTEPDNTPLHFEIERWDPAEKKAEVWILLDTVYGNSDTQFFTMHWGDTISTPASLSGAVFDTAKGYQGVWHLSETEFPDVFDATRNAFDGKAENIRENFTTEGAIAIAKPFNGGTTYIRMINSSTGKLDFKEDDSFSISAWVYLDTLDDLYHQIVSKGNHQYGLQVHKDGHFQFFSFSEEMGWVGVRAPAEAKKWTFLTGVKNSSTLKLYIDGVLASEEIITIEDHSQRDTGHDLHIGRRADVADRFWTGSIDEVRICSQPRSASRIKLEFMNQKDQNTLIEIE
ncbi:MAG: DUF2341 domain-containing protein [Chitinispirillaceae bacterium]